MYEPPILAAIAATFLLAGTVKGVIGLGLPTVSLALLTATLDLTSAMALLLIPSFVTNLWQALVPGDKSDDDKVGGKNIGGKIIPIIARLWPFLLLATGTVWLGAMALTRTDLSVLSALLGGLLIAYASANLAGLRLKIRPHQERWAGPLAGLVNGILTGMTGSFVVPGVMFLQAIGLPRDMLVQAMGLLFTLSTLALGLALGTNNLLSPDLATLSTLALVPAIAGMIVGQKIRGRLSEKLFQRVFFIALLLLGSYITVTALSG
jgi:uncharacterized membrane protein YfcA